MVGFYCLDFIDVECEYGIDGVMNCGIWGCGGVFCMMYLIVVCFVVKFFCLGGFVWYVYL